MTDKNNQQDVLTEVPSAQLSQQDSRVSIIWVIPLVALIAGAWLVYKNITDQGPVITVQFSHAEGIEPLKTQVKFRNVDVGLVQSIKFADDLSKVIATVQLVPGTEDWLNELTRFWMVRPRLELTGVTGLSTLLSGTYLAMDPGKGSEPQSDFIALDDPPVILSAEEGTIYKLRAASLGSISIGSPIYFRQIAVGEVMKYRLVPDHSYVEIDVFINRPHDQFVRQNTSFWNASGIDVDLNAEGLNVNVESLSSLLTGGIVFETPNVLINTSQAPEGRQFTLYASRQQSREKPITVGIPYLVYFQDTVRGLKVGAPVEFRGIRIGTVKDISIKGELDTARFEIPVLIEIEPDRVVFDENKLPDLPADRQNHLGSLAKVMIERLIEKGLRARLATGNLLTGQLFIEFDIHRDAETIEITSEGPYPVLPTIPSSRASIEKRLTNILSRLEGLPINQIGQDVSQAAAGINKLINDEGMMQALERFNSALQKADVLINTLNEGAGPMFNSITLTSEGTRKAVQQAEETLSAIEDVVDEQGPIGNELKRALEELSSAARSIRIMAEYLERHPEAIFKGKIVQ